MLIRETLPKRLCRTDAAIILIACNSAAKNGLRLPRRLRCALRAVAAGYGRVYWYRGGVDAWTAAALPTARAADRR